MTKCCSAPRRASRLRGLCDTSIHRNRPDHMPALHGHCARNLVSKSQFSREVANHGDLKHWRSWLVALHFVTCACCSKWTPVAPVTLSGQSSQPAPRNPGSVTHRRSIAALCGIPNLAPYSTEPSWCIDQFHRFACHRYNVGATWGKWTRDRTSSIAAHNPSKNLLPPYRGFCSHTCAPYMCYNVEPNAHKKSLNSLSGTTFTSYCVRLLGIGDSTPWIQIAGDYLQLLPHRLHPPPYGNDEHGAEKSHNLGSTD